MDVLRVKSLFYHYTLIFLLGYRVVAMPSPWMAGRYSF